MSSSTAADSSNSSNNSSGSGSGKKSSDGSNKRKGTSKSNTNTNTKPTKVFTVTEEMSRLGFTGIGLVFDKPRKSWKLKTNFSKIERECPDCPVRIKDLEITSNYDDNNLQKTVDALKSELEKHEDTIDTKTIEFFLVRFSDMYREQTKAYEEAKRKQAREKQQEQHTKDGSSSSSTGDDNNNNKIMKNLKKGKTAAKRK